MPVPPGALACGFDGAALAHACLAAAAAPAAPADAFVAKVHA
eukprot:gene16935-13691_t